MKCHTSSFIVAQGKTAVTALRTWQQLSAMKISGGGTSSALQRPLRPSRSSRISAFDWPWQNRWYNYYPHLLSWLPVLVTRRLGLTQLMISPFSFIRLMIPPFKTFNFCFSWLVTVAFVAARNVLSNEILIPVLVSHIIECWVSE